MQYITRGLATTRHLGERCHIQQYSSCKVSRGISCHLFSKTGYSIIQSPLGHGKAPHYPQYALERRYQPNI